MKRLLIVLHLIIYIGFALDASAQLPEEQKRVLSFIQKAMNYNHTVPQEKVYMHFDNTGYFEDETMWFKAYVTRTDIQRPSDLSKVLYVELLNPSGDVIRTQKYPIDERGEAYGDMKLDTLLGSGFYEVRAYTRYMTNWGGNACFSRVFPVFKVPNKQDVRMSELTINTTLYTNRTPNGRSKEDSLYLKAIEDGIHTNELNKTVTVRFYPEGGDLIVGKRSKVAVMMVDDNGNSYKGTGYVQNAKGDVLATVVGDSLGRGLFDIIPDGTDLSFQIKNLKNKMQVFDLPKAKDEGCVLTLDAVSDNMLAKIQCSDGLTGHLIGLVTMNNGNVTYCDTVVAQPLIEIELDRAKHKPGVNQFTVFDSYGRILAERMFFIRPEADTADSIRLTIKTPKLSSCSRVTLDVEARPNSSFSFSAMDRGMMTNSKQGNIHTWMLLSSDVKGYIHNVDYYFESDDKEHRQAADLLMLTQGWRRYDWEMMGGFSQFNKVQPIEDKFYLYGKLNEYRKKNPVKNVNLQAFLYNAKGESLSGETTTDENGNYAFALPFMDGEWKMQIFTRLNDKRKTYYVGIDRQFSPQPRYITPLESKLTRPNKANLFDEKKQIADIEEEDEFIPMTRKDHVLQNVTVKAKRRRYFTNDDWNYKNESYGRYHAATYYDIDRELDKIRDFGMPEPSLFQFLLTRNSSFKNRGTEVKPGDGSKKEIIDPITGDTIVCQVWDGRFSYNNRKIAWVVNNGERGGWGISDDAACYFTSDFPLWLDEIKSMYVVPSSPDRVQVSGGSNSDSSKEPFNIAEPGDVVVYLYTHIKYSTESQKGLRHTYFQGFNKPSTFKTEDYSTIPPMPDDFRRTIYWTPNVRTDAKGKATIEFFNNSTCKHMFISAEGMSSDGKTICY